MLTLLDSDTITTALEALPGWQATDGHLVRTVHVQAGTDALLRSVRQIADELGHQPDTRSTVRR